MLIQLYMARFFLFTFIGNLNSCDSCISINLSAVKSEKQNVIINVIVQNHTSKTISLHGLIKRCDDIDVYFPWKLKIIKEGKEYEFPKVVTGEAQIIKIRRKSSSQFNLCINFETLVGSEKIANPTGVVSVNRDYGIYDITLSYTNKYANKEWKCTKSNQLKVPYEKNH